MSDEWRKIEAKGGTIEKNRTITKKSFEDKKRN